MISCLNHDKEGASPLKIKHSKSVFWEYVLVCTLLTLITCVCIGAVLGSVYLRTINSHNEQMVQS